MPFSFHRHSHSSSQPNNAHQLPSGILQVTQNLGGFGIPTLNTTRTSVGPNFVPPPSPPPPPPSQAAPTAPSSTGEMSRRNDELHLSGPLSPRDYTPGGPRIALEQATPETSQYHNAAHLPGSLQPGRPGPMSMNTAPNVPTIPQDPYSTPSRSSGLGLAHNYTRSSPAAAFDGQAQGYGPYPPTTPGTDQFTSPTTSKYTPQNAQRTISNTPLGLADIRPRADSNMSEGLPGANPYSYDGANAVPTNSNYLAPWAIYAFDWCKWPAQNHDAGKVAVGSYLEDGHNFVSAHTSARTWLIVADTNSRHTNNTHSIRILRPRSTEIRSGLREDSRSDTFIPSYALVVGTPIFPEAVHRSSCNLWRPFTSLVLALRDSSGITRKLNH